jgi:hypothetical protein
MYALIDPAMEAGRHNTWLTIGDSGGDADALLRAGIPAGAIVASSIGTEQLSRTKSLGFLADINIVAINAEDIPYETDKFDFVLAKEVYHHFARPAIGLYEMLRVARIAVILIEPLDFVSRPLDFVRDVVKRALRRSLTQGEFEYYGNYTHRLSLRETRKLMTAAAYSGMYTFRFNDYGDDGQVAPITDKWQFFVYRSAIAVQNCLARFRLLSWGKACLILSKRRLPEDLQTALLHLGYTEEFLPRNPYLFVE